MDTCKDRPQPGDPPALDSPIEILKELLSIERERLQVALRIEKERNIVFPETTVIIKDIQRLSLEIERRKVSDSLVKRSSMGDASEALDFDDFEWG